MKPVKWPAVLAPPLFVRAAETRLRCGEDPEAFHRGGTTPEAAEELCRGCPQLLECRAYGLENRESGVWGGWTTAQRDAERRRAAKVA
ncbi:WhiB family transcriptional regulator [Streptomyces stelliscabiei]|uniref:WhiB family transcriptional regulator n=1 Tax=Streptomyces stelliscabiei TaxID=146820 RepID=UPI002FEED704